MIEDDEQIKILKIKAKKFCDSKEKVHIPFKNGYWKRGIITELSDDFFMLDESLEGLLPVFFLELKDIQMWRAAK